MSGLFGLSLLQTGAVLALLSLAIPLLIHLFNRSRGKLIYTGNIELVKQLRQVRVTEIKMSQWLLLLLRLLILSLLALLLMKPVSWQTLEKSEPPHLFFSEQWLYFADENSIQEIESQYPDARWFLLAPELTELTPASTGAMVGLTDYAQSRSEFHLDSLLIQVEQQQMFAARNLVFATNLSQNFSMVPAHLNFPVEWQIKNLSGEELDQITPATSAKRVLVAYTEQRQQDVAYLRLALNTLVQASEDILQVEYLNLADVSQQESLIKAQLQTSDISWLMLLSERALSPSFWSQLPAGLNLLTDADSGEQQMSWVRQGDSLIEIYRRQSLELQQELPASKILWRDNSGNPLWIKSLRQGVHHWQLATRFNPVWSNWVEKAAFPGHLALLIDSTTDSITDNDDQQLLSPSSIKQRLSFDASEPVRKQQDWRPLLMFLLALLWLVERFISERRSRRDAGLAPEQKPRSAES